jgi:putative transcription factor
MPSCELCGQDADSLTKTKIEGAKLDVCESCAEMGEKVETPSKNVRKKKKKHSSRKKKRDTKSLANNYGELVKNAREDKQLSIQELSDELNEKASLLKKIEQEKLKPEKSLAGKLEKKFGIELYVNAEVSDYDDRETGDDRKATLGDVADVK